MPAYLLPRGEVVGRREQLHQVGGRGSKDGAVRAKFLLANLKKRIDSSKSHAYICFPNIFLVISVLPKDFLGDIINKL
jgi:hypothetical protein